MNKRQMIAVAVLCAATPLAFAASNKEKNLETGKDCVSYFSAQTTRTGLVQMNFRNTCDSPFTIQVHGVEHTRESEIKAGTPEEPAKGQVLCSQDDDCVTAKWDYK
jgi:hypothetical protein